MKIYEINDKQKFSFSCIYLWTNNINGKVYVGQTQNFYQRMRQYMNQNDSHRIIGQAINKYGFDNFDIEILEKDLPLKELNMREQYWMDYYQSYNRSNGYNLCTEAGTTRGYKHTQQAKEMMSEKHKQIFIKNPDKLKGENNPNYGKKASKETRQKMSESRKGNQNAKGKHWTLNQEQRERRRQNALGNQYCLGRQLTEYHRQRIIESNKSRFISNETRQKMSNSHKGKTAKKVRCIETNTVYNSITEAANAVNISMSGIINCCKGKQETCAHYHWEYVL